MNKTFCTILFSTLCIMFSPKLYAQEDSVMQSVNLDSIIVRGNLYNSDIKTSKDGSILWNMRMMEDLPKILGNADPIHFAQTLPGIQTNAEYQSGIHIQGCESSHNYISIGNVPIYNVNHLLGFFSTFNASHFPTLRINKQMPLNDANRLGGTMSMQLPTEIAEKAEGEFSIGLISSQGTMRMPLSQRTNLTLSLRASYLNYLYGSWLKIDGSQMKYSFYDINATITHNINDKNKLLIDFYGGNDNGEFFEGNYLADMRAKWGNTMGAVHWIYENEKAKITNTIYCTSYHNDLNLYLPNMRYDVPSHITDIAYKSNINTTHWNAGIDILFHNIQPQSLNYESEFDINSEPTSKQHSVESSAYAEYTLSPLRNVNTSAGLRATVYFIDKQKFYSADPTASVKFDNHYIQLSAAYSIHHQYMFQTGFTDAGLPTEFWMSANKTHRPQYGHGPNISASTFLFNRKYQICVDIYYKWLYNQIEYNGSILDCVNTKYDIDNALIHGKGYNYGFNILLNKCSGKLNGWMSYAYTRARRKFKEPEFTGYFPANHERPHEFNAVVNYGISPRWNICTTFTCASGTPFTAPVSLSMINNNIVCEYGEHNSNRLKPYIRLDLSINYKWKPRFAKECAVNISFYNLTSRSNDLFYRIKTKENSFAYRPISFVLKILPSISFFCKI